MMTPDLRQLIRDGRYEVKAELVAEALMRWWDRASGLPNDVEAMPMDCLASPWTAPAHSDETDFGEDL